MQSSQSAYIKKVQLETAKAKETIKRNELHNISWWLEMHDQLMHQLGLTSNRVFSVADYLKAINLELNKSQRQRLGMLTANWIKVCGYNPPIKKNGKTYYSTRYFPILEHSLATVLGIN